MKIEIIIEGKFGSKFREEYAPQSLLLMVKAWIESERSFNKKTKLSLTIKPSSLPPDSDLDESLLAHYQG